MKLKTLILIFFLYNLTFAKDFTIASYNVENFFDLKYDKTEYDEYIPNTKSNWNQTTYNTKLNNILKTIKDMDKDVIALQEIESDDAFNAISEKLPQYKYTLFKKYETSSVGLAILSKYEIVDFELLDVKYTKVNRPILKITLNIENNKLILFNNHWPSKRNAENQRILYAQKIQDYVKDLDNEVDYIILGDLNSNYNEDKTFKFLKLNNTYGLTGINDVLNTKVENDYINKNEILNYEKKVHYNLWLELNTNERFSYKFKGKKETPDNIILSKSMFDNKNISYVDNSFKVFMPEYLIKNGKINRWEIQNKIHKNRGFSDHLPIYATFSTSKQNKILTPKINTIKEIYSHKNLSFPITISDVILLYKTEEIAIIKQINDRAIFVFKNTTNLNFNKTYTLNINKTDEFNGLLEIVDFTIEDEKINNLDNKSFYLDATEFDILKNDFQNEIITNISGFVKNGYFLYLFKNEQKKIKLYSKNKELLPKNGQKITIINAHLGFYKTKPQIIIYNKSDYKYVD